MAGLFSLAGAAQAFAASLTVSGTVKGQVAGPDKPLPEVAIRLRESGGEEETVATTTTDEHGAYLVEVEPGTYDVEVVPPGGSHFEGTTLHAVEIASNTSIPFVLSPRPSRFSGVVRNSKGEPVSGVVVDLLSEEGPGEASTEPTAEDGEYELAVPAGEYRLRVHSEGAAEPGVPSGFHLESEPFAIGEDAEQDITLPPTLELKVEVSGPEGPVAGAFVSIPALSAAVVGEAAPGISWREDSGEIQTPEEETDAEGIARFPTFASSGGCECGPAHLFPPPPYVDKHFNVPAFSANVTIKIVLQTPVHVSGVIRNSEGEPVEGAVVGLFDAKSSDEIFVGPTGEDGRYELPVAPGEYQYLIYAVGHAEPKVPSSFDLYSLPFTVSEDTENDITLPPTLELKVEVSGPEGPVEGAETEIQPLPTAISGEAAPGVLWDEELGVVPLPNEVTGSEGIVSFSTFASSGSCHCPRPTLYPPAPFSKKHFDIPAFSADTTVQVALEAPIQVSGVIRNSKGEPVSGVAVGLVDDEDHSIESSTEPSGEDGKYELSVSPGKYRFEFLALGGAEPGVPKGFELITEPVSLSKDTEQDLSLPTTLELNVEVSDPEGPVEGAEVEMPLLRSAVSGEVAPGISWEEGEGVIFMPEEETDSEGIAQFASFASSGSCGCEHGTVYLPPPYLETPFDVPAFSTDTTIKVSLKPVVSVQEGTLVLFTASHSPNEVVVSQTGEEAVELKDPTGVTAGENCSAVDEETVTCEEVEEIFLLGGEKNDTLTVDADIRASLLGEGGNDALTGGGQADFLEGAEGNDVVRGGAGNDFLCGCAGNDNLRGDSGADELGGDEGNDTLNGGGGDDLLVGGEGEDTVTYATSHASVDIDLSTGTADGDGHDEVLNVERATGSPQDDSITGDANVNILKGSGGDDLLEGADARDSLIGGLGADELIGGQGGDILEGGAGDDLLEGGGGSDTVTYAMSPGPVEVDLATGVATGDGNDEILSTERVKGSPQGDTIIGSPGSDILESGGGDDLLEGRDSRDSLVGGSGSDEVIGGEGGDTLEGGAGDDLLEGGGGSDTVTYAMSPGPVEVDLATGVATGDGNDEILSTERVRGSPQGDTIVGDSAANILEGGLAGDHLEGGKGNDTLHGDEGDDEISGGVGNDHLYGDPDDDHLDGGPGVDYLDGGSGSNTCVEGAGDTLLPTCTFIVP